MPQKICNKNKTNKAASLYDDAMAAERFPHYWWFVWAIHWRSMGSPHISLVVQSFDVAFVASLGKLLNKQMIRPWFETPWRGVAIRIYRI